VKFERCTVGARTRGLLALASAIGSFIAAGSVRAEGASSRLVYERRAGAESCPSETELRDAVAARLGYDPFTDGAANTLRVVMSRDGNLRTARIERIDVNGETTGARTLDSEATECTELASATSFAVAIALDPESFTRPAPKAAGVAAPPAPPRGDASPPAAPAPARSDEPSPSFFVGASGHAAFLAAPSVAPGARVHGGVRYGAFSAALGARLDVPVSGEAEGGSGRVESSLMLGELVPCGHVGPAAFCGVVALGALRGRGYEVSAPDSDTTLFFAIGPRVEGEWRFAGPLGLLAQGDVLAHATRPAFELDGVEAYRTPLLSVVLGLGMRLHLGEGAHEAAPAVGERFP
jgi:hypothetical protein